VMRRVVNFFRGSSSTTSTSTDQKKQ
jgi:hypothetical protein